MSPHSLPRLTTDDAAEAFLDQDLSDLDFTRFQPLDWERLPKTARIILRVPEALNATAISDMDVDRASDSNLHYSHIPQMVSLACHSALGSE